MYRLARVGQSVFPSHRRHRRDSSIEPGSSKAYGMGSRAFFPDVLLSDVSSEKAGPPSGVGVKPLDSAQRPDADLFYKRQQDGLAAASRIATTASLTFQRPQIQQGNSLTTPVILPPGQRLLSSWRERFKRSLPLIAILWVQSVLSLRLTWSNTAFTDEALYLRSGHLEIQHWLHGTQIPAFPTYFSGAPVLYPPLGALADSIGGLAGARILSLAFMLCATSLLWSTTAHLFGNRPAFLAAALFALQGPVLRLGAFATYDAMALALIATASWCAVRAARQERASGWLVAVALALATANATKYASALFDPVVAALLFSLSALTTAWKQALARSCVMMGYVAGMLLFLFTLGGGEYATGVEQTTLARTPSTDSAVAVLDQSWQLTAIVASLSFLALALCLFSKQNFRQRGIICVLTLAILLVPLQQARIHTLTSLNKHVAFGGWFAAIAAGYAIELLISLVAIRGLRRMLTALFVAALIFPGWMGFSQAKKIFSSWPNSAAVVATLSYLLPKTSGPILDDNNRAVPEYYLPKEGTQWYRWSIDSSLRLPKGRTLNAQVGGKLAPNLYAKRITSGYFSVVILNFSAAASLDYRLLPALRLNPHYRLVAVIPYGGHHTQVWDYQPQNAFVGAHLAPITRRADSPLGAFLTPVARLKPLLGSIDSVVLDSGIAVLFFTALVRFAWRRGKAPDDI